MSIADEWSFPEGVTYLNHGSFGPSPRCVREARQEWTETLERHAKPWNAEDIEELGGMLFNGKTIPQIANAMGRTQEAVRGKAQALDMLPKRMRRKSVNGAASSALFASG